MTTTIKRAATIKRRWSQHRKMLFAVTDPDGGLSEVSPAESLDAIWREFAHDLRSTPADLREEGWRIWPCAVEWREDE